LARSFWSDDPSLAYLGELFSFCSAAMFCASLDFPPGSLLFGFLLYCTTRTLSAPESHRSKFLVCAWRLLLLFFKSFVVISFAVLLTWPAAAGRCVRHSAFSYTCPAPASPLSRPPPVDVKTRSSPVSSCCSSLSRISPRPPALDPRASD
jgi:hypothetical protein